ncbi:MAG TPA: pantoate--beta-alanine ligase [Mycobacteriales bacterium]|nr:pantoate--beta-alanine ligase [Mycobacteriales bacterium]
MTEVARTRHELAQLRDSLDGSVAVVMTMGALHDGHAQLLRFAREHADRLLATVFVNPLQFGEGEDFDRYPRTWDVDLEVCRREGVDLVFAPPLGEMYPNGQPDVRVDAGPLGARLDGEHRPGHFDGVLTVVLKLMHLIRPDVAVYGEKDAQQLALIRRMVTDLDLPVRVLGVPTVREPDGLALSSRNRYLSPEQRVIAVKLSRALSMGVAAAPAGFQAVLDTARRCLAEEPSIDLDYVALVDDTTWQDADETSTTARLLVAGRVGTTRLIDNMSVDLGTRSGLKA